MLRDEFNRSAHAPLSRNPIDAGDTGEDGDDVIGGDTCSYVTAQQAQGPLAQDAESLEISSDSTCSLPHVLTTTSSFFSIIFYAYFTDAAFQGSGSFTRVGWKFGSHWCSHAFSPPSFPSPLSPIPTRPQEHLCFSPSIQKPHQSALIQFQAAGRPRRPHQRNWL